MTPTTKKKKEEKIVVDVKAAKRHKSELENDLMFNNIAFVA